MTHHPFVVALNTRPFEPPSPTEFGVTPTDLAALVAEQPVEDLLYADPYGGTVSSNGAVGGANSSRDPRYVVSSMCSARNFSAAS